MDNLTHSLFGVALGHAIPRLRKSVDGARNQALEKAILWSAVLGSNLPDLDFLMPPLAGRGKLAYLLHHRGHTHTFLFIPLLAVAACFLALWISKAPRREWRIVYAAGLAGGLFHVGMDFTNDYGVHPFSPFLNRWFYGDFIFIVEPLILFGLIPHAFFKARSLWARVILVLAEVALLALTWRHSLVPLPISVFLTAIAALAILVFRKFRDYRIPFAWVATVWLIFGVASGLARSNAKGLIAAAVPAETVVDISRMPAPGDPLCWRVITSSRDITGKYILREGVLSLAPGLIAPQSCMFRINATRTAPLTRVQGVPQPPWMNWSGEFRGALPELLAQRSASCQVDGFLRYARFPFWLPGIVGDLRYDREAGLGFAEFDLSATKCPWWIPDWDPPVLEGL